MKKILHFSLSANGGPSEVKARIASQVAANADTPEGAKLSAAIREAVDDRLAGLSEDVTLSVKAEFSVTVEEAPPIVVERQKAELEIRDGRIRELEATLAELRTPKEG